MQEDQPNPNPKTTTPASEKTQNEVEGQLQCPRCGSKNTKFGYYNNYKLTQPRHYCKNCHRHWTKGGTLRNVPVGGGSRRISGKRATSKKVISKPPTSPAISASMMKLPLTNSVPVPVQSEMPLVPVFCDYQGYAGNFNVGWPYMRSSSESGSNGGNERFNGDLNMFFRDLW